MKGVVLVWFGSILLWSISAPVKTRQLTRIRLSCNAAPKTEVFELDFDNDQIDKQKGIIEIPGTIKLYNLVISPHPLE